MYDYKEIRESLFTEEGQLCVQRARDFVVRAITLAGAVRASEIMGATQASDVWLCLACVDRLVEMGDIREITSKDAIVSQHRVFVSGRG